MTTAAKRLPVDMTTPPSFRKVNPADQPVLFLGLRSDTLPMNQVDEYAETLIGQRISTLPGIAQVLVFGAQKFAVRVQADPNAMAAAGISMGQLQNALAAVDSDTPVGQINGPKQSATIRAPGQLKKAEVSTPETKGATWRRQREPLAGWGFGNEKGVRSDPLLIFSRRFPG